MARPVSVGLVSACVLLMAYAASPYVALWRVGVALRSHDVSSLRAEIDWNGVRNGLKAELGGDPSPLPTTTVAVKTASSTAADDDLPDFGESFAKTAVSNVVDEDCDAEHIGAMLAGDPARGGSMIAQARRMVAWAFFTGPKNFQAFLRVGGDPHEAPVKVQMRFSPSHGWRIENVWLPQTMLSSPDAKAT
jgi:hypothetical protein